jgi:hypothetical protein
VRSGAGRTPLIIAGVAALFTYAAFGHQSPFAFLHNFGHHKHSIAATASSDAEDAAADAREQAAEAADTAEEARGNSHSETREVAAFDRIQLVNGATAEITVGDTQSLEVTVAGTFSELITTDVHDGKLVVGGHSPAAHLRVTVPHLRALEVDGPGRVSIDGLHDPISITANGQVKVTASGTVDSADLTLNGPSKFSLTDLVAKNVTIHVNGTGIAEVYATDSLTANVEGVGHVRYRGDPHTVASVHGMGSVKRLSASDAG